MDKYMPGTENTTGDSPDEDSSSKSNQAEVTAYVPSTEEQIRVAQVGELVPLVAPSQIVDYDPEWPLLYERTKRELARNIWKYMQNYTDAKTTIVEEILARAQKNSGTNPRG